MTTTRQRGFRQPGCKQPDITELGPRPTGNQKIYKKGSPEADAKRKEVYLAALPRYFTQTAALAKAGATPGMLKRWREQDGAFMVAEDDARGELADKLEAEAIRRAFKGIRQPVYQGGLLAGYITQYSDQLLTLMLKAMRPERFRERSEVSVTQPIIKVVSGFEAAEVL